MTDPTTSPTSDVEKLARNMMSSAKNVDDAMANLHSRLEMMLEATHGVIQAVVAECAELRRQLPA